MKYHIIVQYSIGDNTFITILNNTYDLDISISNSRIQEAILNHQPFINDMLALDETHHLQNKELKIKIYREVPIRIESQFPTLLQNHLDILNQKSRLNLKPIVDNLKQKIKELYTTPNKELKEYIINYITEHL